MKVCLLLLLVFNFDSCRKKLSASTDDSYVLPYSIGKAYVCIQGNNGSFSHTNSFQYAFDFDFAIGDTITAARGGTVANIEGHFIDGNRTPGEENYVIIRHDDGSYGRYFHLTHNGLLVHVGDHVEKGRPIGLSGDTGFSARPHLHFDVTSGCVMPAPSCQTLPVQFTNSTVKLPVSGDVCLASAY